MFIEGGVKRDQSRPANSLTYSGPRRKGTASCCAVSVVLLSMSSSANNEYRLRKNHRQHLRCFCARGASATGCVASAREGRNECYFFQQLAPSVPDVTPFIPVLVIVKPPHFAPSFVACTPIGVAVSTKQEVRAPPAHGATVIL